MVFRKELLRDKRRKRMNRRRLIGATMLSLVLTVSNVPMVTVRATEDTSVSNKAEFSTDVVY